MRRILVTADLHVQMSDPSRFTLRYDAGVLRSDLEGFILGRPVSFGVGRDKTCMLKVLSPWSDEVWEFRSREEKPGARVFGRFAGPDIFVATGMMDRADTDFRIEMRRCKAVWRQLFDTYPPHSSSDPHDYVTADLDDRRSH